MRQTLQLVEQALEGRLNEASTVTIDTSAMKRSLAKWQGDYAAHLADKARAKLASDRTAQRLLSQFEAMEQALSQLRYKSASDQRARDAVLADLKKMRGGQLDMKATNAALDRLARLTRDTNVRDLEGGERDDIYLERAVREQDEFDPALRDWQMSIRHPMHWIWDVENAQATATEQSAREAKWLEGDAAQVRELIEAAMRRIGGLWGGSPVRIVPVFTWNSRYLSETSATISVFVGAHSMTVFLPREDEEGNRRELEIGDVEEGDREDATDALADYQRLISELEEPGSVEREGERIITLYTARPSEHRAELERSGKLPGGVFLSDDLGHVEGLASDLRGSRAERDIWLVKIKRRHVMRTLKGRTAYYQIIGSKPVEVERMELFTAAGG